MFAITGNEIYEWDLLYNMNKDKIRSKYDIMIAFVHWALIKNGFLCVGLGDDHNIASSIKSSEGLPSGWTDIEFYKLRYMYNFELYILYSSKNMGCFCINLMNPYDLSLTIINLDFDVITGINGTLDEIMPNYIDILNEINSTLIHPFLENLLTRDNSTQPSHFKAAFDNRSSEVKPIFPILNSTPTTSLMSTSKLNVAINRPHVTMGNTRSSHQFEREPAGEHSGSGSQSGGGNFIITESELKAENQKNISGAHTDAAAGEGSHVRPESVSKNLQTKTETPGMSSDGSACSSQTKTDFEKVFVFTGNQTNANVSANNEPPEPENQPPEYLEKPEDDDFE